MAKGKLGAEGDGVLLAAVNRKARSDYEILDTYEAGIVLRGSEVKSIRAGGMNLKESYIRPIRGELFLIGCHIAAYSHSPVEARELVRDRKLLLHRREIERLSAEVQKKGLTLVPLRAYFKHGLCKLEFGLGRGKKLHDKRQDIKAREAERRIGRAIRELPRTGSGRRRK